MASTVLALAPVANAARFPEHPIRFIVGFAPGGSNDIVARIIGQKLASAWAVPVVVDNRPGAAGNIAAEIAARAQPDGYTLHLIGANNTINAALNVRLAYDLRADFAPVIQVVSVPLVLVAHPSVGARTVSDLVAMARRSPGKLNYASSGNGSISHLAAELFRSMTKIEMTHVPYKGSAPGEADLMAGRVQVLFTGLAHTLPHIAAGRLTALGVTAGERIASAAHIPTIAESGVPGYESSTWYAIVVPASTPAAIVGRLNTDVNSVLRQPDTRETLLRQGLEPVGGDSSALRRHIEAELEKWSRVVKAAGIRSD